MLRVTFAVCVVMLVSWLGGNGQGAEAPLPDGASAKTDIAASTKDTLPTLTEAQKEQVRLWLEDLKKPGAQRSREALVRVGPGAVPLLLAALEKQDTIQSQQVVEVLGRIGHKAALPKLRELMVGNNQWLRSASVFAIGEIGGKEAVPILIEALKDPSCRVREFAVRILAKLGDLRAVPALIDLLRSPDKELVQVVAESLVQLTDGTEDYGTDWMSWQLWYESEALIGGLGNGESKP